VTNTQAKQRKSENKEKSFIRLATDYFHIFTEATLCQPQDLGVFGGQRPSLRLVSISSTFYKQLLFAQIQKALKRLTA